VELNDVLVRVSYALVGGGSPERRIYVVLRLGMTSLKMQLAKCFALHYFTLFNRNFIVYSFALGTIVLESS